MINFIYMYVVLKAILKELFVWNCHFWVSDPGGFFKLKDLKKQRKSLFRFFDQTQFLGKCFDKQTHMWRLYHEFQRKNIYILLVKFYQRRVFQWDRMQFQTNNHFILGQWFYQYWSQIMCLSECWVQVWYKTRKE